MVNIVYKRILLFLYSISKGIGFGAVGSNIRLLFLRPLLGNKSKDCSNVYIGKHVQIIHPERLILHNNISIHDYCYIDCSGYISIGNDVSIAHNCSFISFNHTYMNTTLPIRSQPLFFGSITIESNCWIGCKAIILKDVTISKNSIVAAGAVVKDDVPAGALVGGCPAKVLRENVTWEE